MRAIQLNAQALTNTGMSMGTPAFTGPRRIAITVRAHNTDPRPIHRVRAEVTPALDAVILKAMSHTPTERCATMSALRDAIATASITL